MVPIYHELLGDKYCIYLDKTICQARWVGAGNRLACGQDTSPLTIGFTNSPLLSSNEIPFITAVCNHCSKTIIVPTYITLLNTVWLRASDRHTANVQRRGCPLSPYHAFQGSCCVENKALLTLVADFCIACILWFVDGVQNGMR